jgi:hypothetical protein
MGHTAAHDSGRLHCRGNCRGRFGLLPVAILMRSDRFISSRTMHSMRSRATSGPDSSESARLGDGTRTLWRPLRTPLFRDLLIADAMSDVGTFMQTVGAAWLMVSLGAGPMCRPHRQIAGRDNRREPMESLADAHVETFLIRSWAEHLRQHERSTKADREVEDRLQTYVTGVPKVRHLVVAESDH